ncbi:glycine cleavage system protein GcvH [Candidatus Woesearchaeota archaeon]|nr:glycine cleavage system protein GcvH [Candidatus Woesearchaeota archaeon]
MNPKELFYTKKHLWCKIDDGIATVGITDHAQKSLTDIVFIELPEVDKELKVGESFGSIESVKSVSEVFAPISGKVTEVNSEVEDTPEIINEDPYNKGWLIKIKLSDSSEQQNLLSAEKYEEFTSS